jgi:hypothetical protein
VSGQRRLDDVKALTNVPTAAHAGRMTNSESTNESTNDATNDQDLARGRPLEPREGDPRPPATGDDTDGRLERGDEPNDLDADNAVEEDTIETVDPDNAPA